MATARHEAFWRRRVKYNLHFCFNELHSFGIWPAKNYPSPGPGATVAAIGAVFVNHDIGNRYFPFREAPPFRAGEIHHIRLAASLML
jgi:hypothetical protein